MKKGDECSRKIAELVKLAEQHGTRVKESSVGSIGFVGGARHPQAKRENDDSPAGSPGRLRIAHDKNDRESQTSAIKKLRM